MRRVAGLSLLFFVTVSPGFGQDSTFTLLRYFEDGWQEHWMERRFAVSPTLYQVFEEDSNKVLSATSLRSASGLWHMLDIHPGSEGKISWRWKISKNLSKKNPEKTKKGDDYAARVFIVFEPHFVSWRTRAICYVWAAKEKVGAIYSSPYAETVKTIVLQSGDENKGNWIQEERDYVEDYNKVFGKPPQMITAVAVMVDTDNTGQKATTWFDDLVLKVKPPEKPAASDSTAGLAPQR